MMWGKPFFWYFHPKYTGVPGYLTRIRENLSVFPKSRMEFHFPGRCIIGD